MSNWFSKQKQSPSKQTSEDEKFALNQNLSKSHTVLPSTNNIDVEMKDENEKLNRKSLKKAQKIEKENDFISRMLTIYEDKIFDEKLLLQFENLEIKINRHSSTLVVICINKLYSVLDKYI